MDDFYSVRLAGEVRRGMAERASRGGTMSASPFGYKNENGTLVPHPENAKALQRIFSLFLEGMPYRQIAEEMNDLGYRLRRGGRFEGRVVKYTLLNPVYIGKIRFSPTGSGNYFSANADDEIIAQGHHEPLIDEETFQKVQERIAEIESRHVPYRRESTKGDYMLKGLVRCDACGATLVKSVITSLQCNNYAKGSCKVSHSIVETKLNNMVISSLETILKSGEFELNVRKRNASSDIDSKPDERIRAEYRKLNRVKEAYAAGVDTLEEYRANKKRITDAINQLEEKAKPEKKIILEKEKAAFARKHIKTVEQLYDSEISPEEKNKLLKGFVETIIYNKRNESLRFVFYMT